MKQGVTTLRVLSLHINLLTYMQQCTGKMDAASWLDQMTSLAFTIERARTSGNQLLVSNIGAGDGWIHPCMAQLDEVM